MADSIHEIGSTQEEIDDFFYERGWSDGLPIVAPTRDRVDRALAESGLGPSEVIGPVPVENRVLDGRTLAVNAVMAGCRGEHLLVVRAAMQALLMPEFNLAGVTTTTHPSGPLLVLSGPVVDRLKFNVGAGALGPGNRASAVIGRAIRLILFSVGGGRPGVGDMATIGIPDKYSYVLPENSAATPWEPLSTRLGFAPAASTVTVVAGEGARNVNDHSRTAAGLIRTIAGTIGTLGHNNFYRGGPVVIVLCPEHARVIADGGLGPADFEKELFATALVPLSAMTSDNLERYQRIRPERFGGDPAKTSVPVTLDPSELITVVTGGVGKNSLVIPSFGTSTAVTVEITP